MLGKEKVEALGHPGRTCLLGEISHCSDKFSVHLAGETGAETVIGRTPP